MIAKGIKVKFVDEPVVELVDELRFEPNVWRFSQLWIGGFDPKKLILARFFVENPGRVIVSGFFGYLRERVRAI